MHFRIIFSARLLFDIIWKHAGPNTAGSKMRERHSEDATSFVIPLDVGHENVIFGLVLNENALGLR
jgi:hypothetical protein